MNAAELVILAAIWGASFLFMRIGAPEWGPIVLITLRVSIAALILLPVLRQAGALRLITKNALPLLVIGVTNSALPFSLFAYSTLFISAGFSSILNATTPLWGALIGYLWLGAPLTRLQAYGLLTGITGVTMLVWGKIDGSTSNTLLAVMAATFAALLYGFAANYLKKHLQGVPSRVIAFGSQFFASLALWPLALLTWPTQPISLPAWGAVAMLGVVCTGLAYILYFRLVENAGITYAMSVTFLVPVFGTLWSVCFLDEHISLSMLIDSVIILIGIALTSGKINRFTLRGINSNP